MASPVRMPGADGSAGSAARVVGTVVVRRKTGAFTGVEIDVFLDILHRVVVVVITTSDTDHAEGGGGEDHQGT